MAPFPTPQGSPLLRAVWIVPCRGRLRPPRRAERRWVRCCTYVPRSRSCCSMRCIEQPGLDSATRTRLVPRRVLSRLARDFLTWQAVVALGVVVHLWRLEVQQWRQLLVRARPQTASPHVAAHRLWPAVCCRLHAPGLLATPLISPLTPLRVRLVGAEGREVDDHHHHHRAQGGGRLLGGLPLRSRRSSAPRAHRRAAAGRCEAAWSCKAAAEAAVAVQQRGSCHRAARARRLRVSDGFGGAVLVAFRGQHARRCMRKKLPCSSAFFSRYVHVCACALRVFDSLNCPVHEGMHGVAGPWRFVPS